MKNTSTHYLLKYLYSEAEPTEKLAIEDALSNNWHLRESYNSWQELFKMLNEAKVCPPQKSINNILKYSRNSTLEASY
jgi:hypothetical protein